jgi:hypothetical protein
VPELANNSGPFIGIRCFCLNNLRPREVANSYAQKHAQGTQKRAHLHPQPHPATQYTRAHTHTLTRTAQRECTKCVLTIQHIPIHVTLTHKLRAPTHKCTHSFMTRSDLEDTLIEFSERAPDTRCYVDIHTTARRCKPFSVKHTASYMLYVYFNVLRACC